MPNIKSGKIVHKMMGNSELQPVAKSDISVGFSVYYDPTVNAFGTLTGELNLSKWTVITVEKPVIVLSNGLSQMRLDYGEAWDGSWVPEVGQVIGIEAR